MKSFSYKNQIFLKRFHGTFFNKSTILSQSVGLYKIRVVLC